MLANLDILEEHPDFYEREMTSIKLLETGGVNECWTYFLKKFKPNLLEKEMLISYSCNGPHNLQYCERYLRDPTYDHRQEILVTLISYNILIFIVPKQGY